MRSVFFAIVVFCAAAGARAQAAELRLDPATGISEAIGASEAMRDPTGRRSLADVVRDAAAFRPATTLVPDLHATAFAPSVLWFRLRPRTDGPGPWYVHTTFDVDRGEMFYVAPDGRVERTPFGTLLPYAQRQLPAYTNAFELPPGATRAGTLYLRIVTRRDFFGGFAIRPAAWDAWTARATAEDRLLPGLVIAGMLTALALFNAILGVTLRERIYFWYAASTGCFALYQSITCGAAWRWLWPHASIAFSFAAYAAYLAYFAMVLLFARDFLKLATTQRLLWRAIVAIYGLVAAVDALNVIAPNVLDSTPLSPYVDALTSGVLLGAILCSGIVAWRRGMFGAGAYTLAFAGVVIGLIVGNLGYDVLIPDSGWTYAAPGLGVAWEAIFLALALTERIRRLRGERDALEVAARVDALTGIANRRAFDERLSDEWRLAQRGGTPLALLLLDIDYFKSYNDVYGHPGGDRVLTAVAGAIARSLRRADDFAARYGGEEFIVLLPCCDGTDAVAVADTIRGAVQGLGIVHRDNPSSRVTISAGAASSYPDGSTTPAQLIDAADRALYDAKNSGRNRVAASTALVA